MKESIELQDLLSSVRIEKEIEELSHQIEDFEHYITITGVDITKRQLILAQEEKFKYQRPNELVLY